MLIKVGNKTYNITEENIRGWREVKTEVFVQQQKVKAKKVKALKQLLNNREYIDMFLELTDNQLDSELQDLTKNSINYDRHGMFGGSIPFKIN